ncbi:YggS family pyridoxal phosphate enzyme [Bdellovibrio bacteriovorus]|uniref:Pyridoxal phosphate homeostasis protein n=2 Tax=Bdellovibrio bacteriovorus TaxID=959 RepID=A0A150WRU9_BDEBC|nr:YggS family pyridoxal phosphate enzyme [Bdellovibrio bacteriovorus]
MLQQDYNSIVKSCAPAQMLAVSKLQPEEKIRLLYSQGQRAFAENYVQEALTKQKNLEGLSDIQWHLIGHLQKNKAKLVAGQFALIHSIDSLELAQVLNRHCAQKNVTQNILLQINVANEDSKEGFTLTALRRLWPELLTLSNLSIQGLMTMPPLTETGAEVRPYFKQLCQLRDELKKTAPPQHPMKELSMGTSHDYRVAIEEGATIVRLGTILFGERPTAR